ncbi:MAG: glycosyltransferase family 4 protein [Ferruginibacter sp.]|nr:glycosyltransferase family 4 protein [Ferruginibacter sp.]
MHDPKVCAVDNKYFPTEIFCGYNANKTIFVKDALKAGARSNIVILSHINLLLVGWLIKKIAPNTTVILLAHGIEIWSTLSKQKMMMLTACNKILSVSSFTNERIQAVHNIPKEKCFVFNNCIDPFLEKPDKKIRNIELIKRYNLKSNDIILLTITRLSEKDRYKGYTQVLKSLVLIVNKNKNIKYILAGSYEVQEKKYVESLIAKYNLQSNVIITGFIKEEELAWHFSLADIYIMPSSKEGFGIVFVEAMYYGVPVIAGNVDGSVDALLQGKLGIIINPEDTNGITTALQKMIESYNDYKPNQALLMKHFGYENYKQNLDTFLN